MYSYEQKKRAVELYIKFDKCCYRKSRHEEVRKEHLSLGR